jgi:propanediol dehydratase small subunit
MCDLPARRDWKTYTSLTKDYLLAVILFLIGASSRIVRSILDRQAQVAKEPGRPPIGAGFCRAPGPRP